MVRMRPTRALMSVCLCSSVVVWCAVWSVVWSVVQCWPESDQQSTQSITSSVLWSAVQVAGQLDTSKWPHDNNSNHHNHSTIDRVTEYERLIYQCVVKSTSQLRRCVQQFNQSVDEHNTVGAIETEDHKVRRFCCLQNQFKDCWTDSIQSGCSHLEWRVTKWLPLQVLTDLRTDHRCHTYVLYPHKCRENSFSLWQILAFLLLVPFVAFFVILLVIQLCKRNFGRYQSIKRSHFDLI